MSYNQDGIRGIREARDSDLLSLTNTHQAAFQGFFLTSLGTRFLREYYATVMSYRRGILLVNLATEADEVKPGEINGFVAGFIAPADFYSHLRTRRGALAISVLPALIKSPSLLSRLMQNMSQAGNKAMGGEHEQEALCELSSIGVDPQCAGQGIGKRLAAAFHEHAQKNGARRVVLTTDAQGNDTVNAFYRSLGYEIARTFEAPGQRQMHEYHRVL